MKENERTYQQWKELAERYFEAQTTDVEEEALARFLATPASQGKEFDELRAVMGFVATGRAIHNRQHTRGVRFRYYAVAAAVTGVLALTAVWQMAARTNVCVAYINGERYTDKEIVFSEAMKSIDKVRHDLPQETVQEQLSDIFQTIGTSVEN